MLGCSCLFLLLRLNFAVGYVAVGGGSVSHFLALLFLRIKYNANLTLLGIGTEYEIYYKI